MWWAVFDLFTTIIIQFLARGVRFPSEVGFPLPYYLKWLLEAVPLSEWSYIFDICAAISIFWTEIFILIGAYLVFRD